MDKAEIARRHLGTALDMFLRNRDPVSVHTLTMAGAELAEWLVEKAGRQPFVNHILETFPEMDMKELRKRQRLYVNAFKHATGWSGLDRDDQAILEHFEPTINEHMLLIGWYDYGAAGLPRPIESQAFEVWYLAKYPEKLNPEKADLPALKYYFPNLRGQSLRRQLERLNEVIRKARRKGEIMDHADTDRRPLLIEWPSNL
jgi:hypothetical protein